MPQAWHGRELLGCALFRSGTMKSRYRNRMSRNEDRNNASCLSHSQFATRVCATSLHGHRLTLRDDGPNVLLIGGYPVGANLFLGLSEVGILERSGRLHTNQDLQPILQSILPVIFGSHLDPQ